MSDAKSCNGSTWSESYFICLFFPFCPANHTNREETPIYWWLHLLINSCVFERLAQITDALLSHCLLRCQPCVRIAPAFNMLSNKYPQVVFLEVDVHVCQVSVICRVHNVVSNHRILDTAAVKDRLMRFIFESLSSEIQFVVSKLTPGFTLVFLLILVNGYY